MTICSLLEWQEPVKGPPNSTIPANSSKDDDLAKKLAARRQWETTETTDSNKAGEKKVLATANATSPASPSKPADLSVSAKAQGKSISPASAGPAVPSSSDDSLEAKLANRRKKVEDAVALGADVNPAVAKHNDSPTKEENASASIPGSIARCVVPVRGSSRRAREAKHRPRAIEPRGPCDHRSDSRHCNGGIAAPGGV